MFFGTAHANPESTLFSRLKHGIIVASWSCFGPLDGVRLRSRFTHRHDTAAGGVFNAILGGCLGTAFRVTTWTRQEEKL